MTKRKVFAIVLAVMMSASWNVSAAYSVHNEPQKTEYKKEIPNPEREATKRTDEMDRLLGLTEKQYKKIYKLYLKAEKEKIERMSGRDGNRPPVHGGRPPMGMGQPPVNGAFPPAGENSGDSGRGGERIPPEHIRERMLEEMKESEEKMLKKIRKILDDGQYKKWLEVKPETPERPVHKPGMPETEMFGSEMPEQ